jgi:hypothetical protein
VHRGRLPLCRTTVALTTMPVLTARIHS